MEKNRVFRHKKSLGQNFLQDMSVLEKIAERANPAPGDVILEIGAGKGVLTERLLSTDCSFLHCVEIDRDLEPFLERIENEYEDRFELHWGNALEMDYRSFLPSPGKVVANIPYHITTPLIWKLLENAPDIKYMLLMVQKEAAQRIAASPGTKDRGPLGVTIEAAGSTEILFTVPRRAFRPAPEVDSCLFEITLDKNKKFLTFDKLWRDMLKYGFGRRRKKLLGNLESGIWQVRWREIFAETGIDENSRAEALSAGEWLDLFGGAKKSMASPPTEEGEATEKLKVQSIQPYP